MMGSGEVVTIQRRPTDTTDRWGDGAAFVDHHDEPIIGINWAGTREVTDGREVVVSDVDLYLVRPDADVLATDRARLPNGQVYRVVGIAEPWRGLTGWQPGAAVHLNRVGPDTPKAV